MIQTLQKPFPRFAGYLACQFWFSPFVKTPSPKGSELFKKSQKSVVDGLLIHSWGDPQAEQVIVLIHGWGGRWDQFASTISFLLEKGFRVVSLDLPAHGDSSGTSTSIIEMAPTFAKLAMTFANPPVYICHSFGLMAISYAMNFHGVPAKALIGINSPSNLHFLIEQFSEKMKLTPRTVKHMISYIKSRVGEDAEIKVKVPFRKWAREMPVFMLADEDDREVPFDQHREAQEVLKERFVTTKGLGHTRILQSESAQKNVLSMLEECFEET